MPFHCACLCIVITQIHCTDGPIDVFNSLDLDVCHAQTMSCADKIIVLTSKEAGLQGTLMLSAYHLRSMQRVTLAARSPAAVISLI